MIVRFGSVEGESVFVQRADEPWATSYLASVLDWVTATSAHFRKRRLLDEKSEELTELTVKRKGTTEKLERLSQYDWRVIQPIKAEADSEIVGQLRKNPLRMIAGIPLKSEALPMAAGTLSWVKTARFSSYPR